MFEQLERVWSGTLKPIGGRIRAMTTQRRHQALELHLRFFGWTRLLSIGAFY